MLYFKILNFKVKMENLKKKKIICLYISRQGGENYNIWYCLFQEVKIEYYYIYFFILLM